MRATSAYFFDKLAYLETDLSGPSSLKDIGAMFVLPAHGKPILQRMSKEDFAVFLNARKSIEVVEAESRTSSDPTTIKQEVSESGASETPSFTNTDLKRKQFDPVQTRDAHVILLYLIQMQDIPKLVGGFRHMYEVAKLATDLARIYDCSDILRPRLAASLHQHRQELFVAIKDDPPRAAMLACRLEDESMLTEALIHMVGCHPEWPDSWTSQHRLERRPECDGILVTIQQKANDLQRRRELLDRELLLNTLMVGGSTTINLASHASTWLVVQIYRDSIANMLNEIRVDDEDDRHYPDPLRVGDVYRKLRRGGDAYLPAREIFSKFEQLRVSFDHAEVLEDLAELKAYASDAVKDVCENSLMLDVDVHSIGHLTCIQANDFFPWQIREPADEVGHEGESADRVEG